MAEKKQYDQEYVPKKVYIAKKIKEKQEKKAKEENEKILELESKVLEMKVKQQMAKKSFKHYVEYIVPNFRFSKFNLELIEKLQLLYEGKITRLIVNMPPRHGKTYLVSELFPTWVLGNDGSEEFVNAAYGASLSQKSSRKALEITQSVKFKNIFPEFARNEAKKAAGEWEVISENGNGGYYGVGVGGGLTGRGYSIGIIDDPTKDRAEAESLTVQDAIRNWFTSVFLTRDQELKQSTKNSKGIRIIIVMTRWHTDDLTGYVEEVEKLDGGDKYEKLIYPAINDKGDPLFFTKEYYEKKRVNVGDRDFEALYQQNPIKSMGSIFKKEYFKYFYMQNLIEGINGVKAEDIVWGIFVDPAFSTNKNSDDVVIMLAGKHKFSKEYYVLDIQGGTISPSESYNSIFFMSDFYQELGLNIQFLSVEQATMNKRQTEFKKKLMERMREESRFMPVYNFISKDKKLDRIKFVLEPQFQNRTINFLHKNDTRWNKLFKKLEDELLKFPGMKHDDYPDTLTQAVMVLESKTGGKDYFNKSKKKHQKEQVIDPLTGRMVYI